MFSCSSAAMSLTSRTNADSVSAPRDPSSDGRSIFLTAMSAPVRALRPW